MDKKIDNIIVNENVVVQEDELINWISNKTKISKDIIKKVFKAESEFLEEKGIITYN